MAFGADDPKVSQSREIATKCHEETDTDRCEAALKMYDCGIATGKQLGINFHDLL